MLGKYLGVLCQDEIYKFGVDLYVLDSAVLLIFLGGVLGQCEYAGVGFLIVFWARQYIIGFTEFTDKILNIKLQVKGGQLGIICAYAVQGGRDFMKRHSFYDTLSNYYSKFNVHGPKLIAGDLNARLNAKRSGEEEILGDTTFGYPLAAKDPLSNRSLLMQLCVRHGLVVANTMFDHELERTVTYHGWGYTLWIQTLLTRSLLNWTFFS